MSRLPSAGETIKIEILTERIKLLLGEGLANETPASPFCDARVLDASDEGVTLELPEPIDGLKTGTSLILHYHDDTGLFLLLAKVSRKDTPTTINVQVKGLSEHQRRRDVRRRVCVPVRYKVERDGELGLSLFEWQDSATVDISRGGILLRVSEGVQAGDNLQLEVDLHSGKVQAEGRVTRTERERGTGDLLAGIRFTSIRPQDQEAIEWFVLSETL